MDELFIYFVNFLIFWWFAIIMLIVHEMNFLV